MIQISKHFRHLNQPQTSINMSARRHRAKQSVKCSSLTRSTPFFDQRAEIILRRVSISRSDHLSEILRTSTLSLVQFRLAFSDNCGRYRPADDTNNNFYLPSVEWRYSNQRECLEVRRFIHNICVFTCEKSTRLKSRSLCITMHHHATSCSLGLFERYTSFLISGKAF